MDELIEITKKCPICGLDNTVQVTKQGYENWKNGMLIQKAMPELTPDQAEILITGIDGECWDNLFKEEEQ